MMKENLIFMLEMQNILKKNRKRTQAEQSRRKYSISYFFHLNDAPIRVCKNDFLSTLSISEKRISYFF